MVNVASLVWKNAAANPDHLAVQSDSVQLTFDQLRQASGRVAAAVRSAGIKPLDRVVLIAPTLPEFAVLYYGLHAAGATVVTLNTMAPAAEIGYVLDDARPALVVAWEATSESAADAADAANVPLWRVTAGAHFDTSPELDAWEHQPEDTAIILYTSGTTGKPKGAELTAANLVANALEFAQVSGIGPDDRVGTALPLFHVYGQAVIMNTTLVAGGSLTLRERFEARSMLELIRDQRLTALGAVPTMWVAMLQEAGAFQPEDFAQFRFGTSGGATIPVEVLRAYKERLGCTLLEGYGLSETTGVATFNDINRPQKPGTVGCAMPGAQVEIRRDGVLPGPDEVGEVFIKGTTVMKGYWNRPDADTVRAGGWLVAHRRPRTDRRRRFPHHRRARQGAHHPRRLQRLPARSRRGALRAPGHRGGGSRRRPRRPLRRGSGCRPRPQAGRRSRPRGAASLGQDPPVGVQGAAPSRVRGRAP